MDIIDSRIQDLENLGYKFRVNNNRVEYSNGVRTIPSTLIVGCSSKDWADFVKKEKGK